jgi:glycosyltransferase involved in cell wall biosynthesis
MIIISPNGTTGTTYNIRRYSKLFGNSKIISMSDPIPDGSDMLFMFARPDKESVEKVQELVTLKRKFICMVTCKTFLVLPIYKELFQLKDTFAVPSEFCKRVFKSLYPYINFKVLRYYVDAPIRIEKPRMFDQSKYIFYTIADPLCSRKQVNLIIQAFNELRLPSALLVIKSMSDRIIKSDNPKVIIMNGNLSDETMHELHNSCHCYINFSSSESVGVGAIEAALFNKPVIMSKYGGGPEHVKTPFTIGCKVKIVGYAEYHFTREMLWGDPCYDSLMKYMNRAYNLDVKYMSHEHTGFWSDPIKIKAQFRAFR